MIRKKYLSVAHFENPNNALHGDTYYQLIKNSSRGFKDEIHDIYFSKSFRYKYADREKRYGNPMGVEATDEQVDSLFKIQNKFGIDISLTINSIETPNELFFEKKLIDEFVIFLNSFYERGLRSCTIASPHIIRSGVLHTTFPEMRWKNTVNHRVSNAQQVLDYIFCGYDTILLDRSLSRNLRELEEIRRAVDNYNKTYKPSKKILTSLLVTEGCLNNCPFKKEHDCMGEAIGGQYFASISKLTCDNWRFNEPYDTLPRNSVDLIVADRETFDEYAKLCDIFKFSGRFTPFKFQPGEVGNRKACWNFYSKLRHRFDIKKPILSNEIIYSDSLTDAINDNVMPFHLWSFAWADPNKIGYYKKDLERLNAVPNIWKTVEGRRLAKILTNCRSQCWKCHECEKTFGSPVFDSALQLSLH